MNIYINYLAGYFISILNDNIILINCILKNI